MHPDTNLDKFNRQPDYEESIAESNIKSFVSNNTIEDIIITFKNYRPKTNIIDVQKLHTSPYLKIKKYKDAAYYGEIVNGKRQGIGLIIHNNNKVYEGQWEVDLKHGQGFEQFQNGCVFQGYYVNGKPEGVGKYQWPNGEFYQGQWLNGLKHGSGMWKGAKGDSYVGEWKFGKADGFGVHVWMNGDRYEGNFKQCLKHGEGTEKFSSGDIYKGSFYQGKPSGYGEYYWVNGSFYKGMFNNGYRQGNAIWKKSSGNSDKYQGQYLKDKKSGYGIFTWYNGNIYKGNYFQDERQGYGQMYWTDGSYYKGQWKKGKHEGKGVLFMPEEGVKKGIFKDNILVEIEEEQQPVNIVIPRIRRNKRRGKSLAGNNKIIAIPAFNSNRKQRKYKSLVFKQKPSSEKSFEIKRRYGNQSKDTSQQVVSPNANNEIKQFGARYKFKQNKSKNLTPIQQVKKQHIPHSSIYMHNIEKRTSALGHSAKNNRTIRITNANWQTKIGSIQIKPFTPQTPSRINHSTII